MTTSSRTPAWHRLSGRRSDSRSEWSMVSNTSSRSRSSYPSRGCSSSPAKKFVRTHPLRRHLASHRTIIHHIALFSHPIPSSTLQSHSPQYPTDMLPLMMGLPDLTSPSQPPRPHLYSLSSAPRTLSATTLSFVVARIRYRPRLRSAALSPPRHLELVQYLV